MSSSQNKTVYLFFGPQGSGKTTQAERLAQRLNWPFFDVGEELRRVAAAQTPLGQKISQVMKAGQLVGNELIVELINNFAESENQAEGLVIDGFPRKLDQCPALDELAKNRHWQAIGIYVEISDQTAEERLAKRVKIVDGREIRREDDQPTIVRKRLATFKAETLPVIDYLKQHYRLIEINGEPDIATVTAEVSQQING